MPERRQKVLKCSCKATCRLQAASTLTHAAMREWTLMDAATRRSLRSYLVSKVLQGGSLERVVKRELTGELHKNPKPALVVCMKCLPDNGALHQPVTGRLQVAGLKTTYCQASTLGEYRCRHPDSGAPNDNSCSAVLSMSLAGCRCYSSKHGSAKDKSALPCSQLLTGDPLAFVAVCRCHSPDTQAWLGRGGS